MVSYMEVHLLMTGFGNKINCILPFDWPNQETALKYSNDVVESFLNTYKYLNLAVLSFGI